MRYLSRTILAVPIYTEYLSLEFAFIHIYLCIPRYMGMYLFVRISVFSTLIEMCTHIRDMYIIEIYALDATYVLP